MEHNLLLMTDSYKLTHWKQYPPGTQYVHSFFESRTGAHFPTTTFFGLQAIIKKYLLGEVVTREKIELASRVVEAHMGSVELFNREGWEYILERYQGRLPIEIKAIPEGTAVPSSNVLMTVENTDPVVPWLTNYLETLLCQVWYPSTVCTLSKACREAIFDILSKTGSPELIEFKLHDFGFRGSTSVESAGMGGMAHLVNFKGTDTMEALAYAKLYYGEEMAGFSIPAAEHSTITSWGPNQEGEAFANMLTQFPKGFVAVVSDSYDIYSACENLWGTLLRNQVLGRNGVLVIRPDSGDPVSVVREVLEILGQKFGFTVNEKGYKVLDPHVRIIQGDGINLASLRHILFMLWASGWSADNIAFGSGGGLLQQMDRDTQRFAFKCSAICVNGTWRPVRKNPVTDPGKASKAGKLALMKDENSHFVTVQQETAGSRNLLETVFLDGILLKDESFETIRKRALEYR